MPRRGRARRPPLYGFRKPFISPRIAELIAVVGQLASRMPPQTGKPVVLSSADGSYRSASCLGVEHLSHLLSETPIFGVLVPRFDTDLQTLRWLWQDEQEQRA